MMCQAKQRVLLARPSDQEILFFSSFVFPFCHYGGGVPLTEGHNTMDDTGYIYGEASHQFPWHTSVRMVVE